MVNNDDLMTAKLRHLNDVIEEYEWRLKQFKNHKCPGNIAITERPRTGRYTEGWWHPTKDWDLRNLGLVMPGDTLLIRVQKTENVYSTAEVRIAISLKHQGRAGIVLEEKGKGSKERVWLERLPS